MTLADQILARTAQDGECLIWQGAVQSSGYGSVGNGLGGTALAHRVVFTEMVGPIEEGMTIDHLCRVRSCVNPDHLEPVTQGENLRRAVPYRRPQKRRLGKCEHDDSDVYIDPSGKRVCRECRRERTRAWRADSDSAYREH